MSLRVQNQTQPEIDSSATFKSSGTQTAAATGDSFSAASNLNAAQNAAQDTASISSATSQLSGDVPIRQDRVDALRAQMETGTYTVNAHAVATAMFQNLFRS